MKKQLFAILSLVITGLISCKEMPMEPAGTERERAAGIGSSSSILSLVTYNVTPSTVLDSAFWATVQSSLQTNPVEVVFANGAYVRTSGIRLYGIGNVNNQLTLRCPTEAGAVFTGAAVSTMISLGYCKNIRIWGLKLTGAGIIDYGLGISICQDIVVEKCHFEDLSNIYYGAMGVFSASTNNILVKNCTFARVGSGGHSHMIYSANGVQRLKIVSSSFTDCAGDFIRYRNLSQKGIVFNNTFTSTGPYLAGTNPPTIAATVFNDVNPGNERLGTNFLVAKNTVNYATVGSQATRWLMMFNSTGYNPTGYTYLISVADAATLNSGTIAQKRSIMLSNVGVDGTLVYFGQNIITNVQYNVVYNCRNGYGSSGPWEGTAYISQFVNPNGLLTMTETQAINFYN